MENISSHRVFFVPFFGRLFSKIRIFCKIFVIKTKNNYLIFLTFMFRKTKNIHIMEKINGEK